MLKFRCPHCDQKIALPPQYAGRQVRCAKCRQSLIVPSASEQTGTTDKAVIRFKCDSCNQKLKVSTKHSGRKLKCPKCSTVLVVPQPTDTAVLGASSTGSTVADGLIESSAAAGVLAAGPVKAEKTPPPLPQDDAMKFQPVSKSDNIRCPSCGAIHSAGRRFCTLCGQTLSAGAALPAGAGRGSKSASDEDEVVYEESRKGNIVLAILASLCFAAVGGAVWCVAAKFIGMGWMSFMAVVVCSMAGGGFYLCTQDRSVGIGILAAIIGLMGILNGKTLIAKYVALPEMKEFMTESAGQFGKAFEDQPMDDEFYQDMIDNNDLMFAMAAMQLAEEGQIEEELVEEIMTSNLTDKKDTEKTEQVKQAEQEVYTALEDWNDQKKKEVVQAQFGNVSQKNMNLIMESEVGETVGFVVAWLWSLSCQDLVWFPLGMFCAYKVARGDE